jgi:hypothetical protein
MHENPLLPALAMPVFDAVVYAKYMADVQPSGALGL